MIGVGQTGSVFSRVVSAMFVSVSLEKKVGALALWRVFLLSSGPEVLADSAADLLRTFPSSGKLNLACLILPAPATHHRIEVSIQEPHLLLVFQTPAT